MDRVGKAWSIVKLKNNQSDSNAELTEMSINIGILRLQLYIMKFVEETKGFKPTTHEANCVNSNNTFQKNHLNIHENK